MPEIFVVEWLNAKNEWMRLTRRLAFGFAIEAARKCLNVGCTKEEIRIRNTETEEISTITSIES